ncbi:MAG: PAS domain S-box protein, partial [Candidatus Obscuribacterales bacterium]|nr:PAS domain S-box protein [Candidatus Obscuribacterales bacterium]
KQVSEIDPKFEALLDHLKRTRDIDLTGYKRSSLMRRVLKRMQLVGIEDFVDYCDYLEVHADEFTELLNTILINVTSFFRDEEAWTYLRQEIIPNILKSKKASEPIRVWSAGCASGQEAYSILMRLCEDLGVEECLDRVKIYATDIDEDALKTARLGSYSAEDMINVPEEYVQKYFYQAGGRFTIRQELRRILIFGRHDLVQDAPISKLDLLTCRNVLMYFNSEMQRRILSRFHFALNDSGYLFVGKAEMLLSHAHLFTTNELKYRIFAKTPLNSLRDRPIQASEMQEFNRERAQVGLTLKDLAFDSCCLAQIIIDSQGVLNVANKCAREMFGLNIKDIGRPLQDLEISYRPVELRSLIEQAFSEKRTVKVNKVERNLSDGSKQFLDIEVAPLSLDSGTYVGVSVTFGDVTIAQKLNIELEKSNQGLETANEELQSTHEELETTNEELQSTNEELETTNEELQSTNEELETMNEELQSTNAELEAINTELRTVADDFNKVNIFLNSILTSVKIAVVVLDANLAVCEWNRCAEDLWGLRAEEVKGKPFFDLDIGLPVDKLVEPARQVIGKEISTKEISLQATNRRGKQISCQINITPLGMDHSGPQGLVLLMESSQ